MPGTIRLHRVLRAPPARVYKAFLDADARAKWLPPHGFTGKVHESDARVGGKYRMSFTNFTTGKSDPAALFDADFRQAIPVMTHEDAHFVVLEVFKGPLFLGQPIRVKGYIGMGACAVSSTNDPVWIEDVLEAAEGDEDAVIEPAKFSKEWLIYSDGPGPYELNMCSRTIPLNMGGDKDLPILREFIKHPPKRP